VLTVFALIGFYRYWYLRLIGSVVAAVVGALAGSALALAKAGATITGPITAQLVGNNLPFVIAVIIATVTAGFVSWKRILGSAADADTRRIAIVRPPSDSLAEGQVTHIERTPVDLERANSQWDEYVAILSNAGWDVVEVPAAVGQPDSVFVEDTMVLFGDLAVIGSPGSESRAGEIVEAERSVADLGLTIRRIELPGTLDGGDVLKVDRTVYVGRGGRTNAEGIRQLRALVTPLGYTVVAVPVTKALHLKSAVTALPDGTVIGFLPLVDDPSVFGRFLAVPEAEGVAVVVLADDTVLMSSAAPKSAALIADLGYRVLTTDITEFEKLEGCVTCLSVRVR
jgi:dimethylargininase